MRLPTCSDWYKTPRIVAALMCLGAVPDAGALDAEVQPPVIAWIGSALLPAISGGSFHGTLAGQALERVPTQDTDWLTWRKAGFEDQGVRLPSVEIRIPNGFRGPAVADLDLEEGQLSLESVERCFPGGRLLPTNPHGPEIITVYEAKVGQINYSFTLRAGSWSVVKSVHIADYR